MSRAEKPDDALERFLAVAASEVERVTRETDRDRIREAARIIREREGRGGRVHVTGVGKPEHLARYAAALLSSTGTPATFLHATEASHGSIGQVRSEDVVIAISNSGATVELLDCVKLARDFGATLIAITGEPESPLGGAANLVLRARVAEEGGPFGLAPRASALAELVVIGALSVELEASKGFGRADYQRRHPAGTLGQLTRDRD